MTQEGRVEDFWTTGKHRRTEDDNVRPLLHALAAARKPRSEDLPTASGVVVDLRPGEVDLVIPFSTEELDPHLNQEARHSPSEIAQAAETAAAALSQAISSREPQTEDWIMVEPERAPAEPVSDSLPAGKDAVPQWGDLWRNSVQGWVRREDGTKVWRPIVTTTTTVPNWQIDTNLGMVTGESACALEAEGLGALVESEVGNETIRKELAHDRAIAQEAMVREAVARGAHAVIGVNLDYTFLGECLVITSTGTAVTLRTA